MGFTKVVTCAWIYLFLFSVRRCCSSSSWLAVVSSHCRELRKMGKIAVHLVYVPLLSVRAGARLAVTFSLFVQRFLSGRPTCANESIWEGHKNPRSVADFFAGILSARIFFSTFSNVQVNDKYSYLMGFRLRQRIPWSQRVIWLIV
jgi:hypothetical protein